MRTVLLLLFLIPTLAMASLESEIEEYSHCLEPSVKKQLQLNLVNRYADDETCSSTLRSFLESELYATDGFTRWNTSWIILNLAERVPFPEHILNDAFLEFQIHSEFLFNLEGAKPISITQAVLNEAGYALDRSGIFKRHGLGILDYGYQRNILVYSLPGIAAMLADSAKYQELQKLQVPVGISAYELAIWFKDFFTGTYHYNQKDFDIISGIFFGYPLRDVLVYADDRTTHAQAQGYNAWLFPKTAQENGFFGFVVVGTGLQPEKSLTDLQMIAGLAVKKYENFVQQGIPARDIIKNWTTVARSESSENCEQFLITNSNTEKSPTR